MSSLSANFVKDHLLLELSLHKAAVESSCKLGDVMGGQYRICWCGQDARCSFTEDFALDAGSLFIIGPAPLGQHRTCIAGLSCSIDGIRGFALNAEDTFLLKDSCEASTAPPDGLLDGGLATMLTASGAVMWGGADRHLTAQGGVYALCWCASLPAVSNTSNRSTCSQAASFVQFGSLTLLGPSPRAQSRTCYSGQRCTLSGLTGLQLPDTSRVRILDSCGGTPILGWPDDFQLLRPTANFSAGSMSTGWGTVSAAGAAYRLCWCYDGQSCDLVGSWVDFGTLHLSGPQPLQQHRTCVTGQLCALDGLTGYAFSDSSHIMVLETCSTDSMKWQAADAVPLQNISNFSLVLTQPGGIYRICWCSGAAAWPDLGGLNGSSPVGPCTVSSDFGVDMGSLLVMGVAPLSQHRTCISGLACSFHVEGLWLATGDMVSVFDTCGVESSRYSAQLNSLWDNSTGTNGSSSSKDLLGAVLRPGPVLDLSGGQYRLCWCQGSLLNCLGASNFGADFGTLTMIGPSPLTQMRTCVAGQACSLDGIGGQDLSPSASFAVLDTCGTSASAPFMPNVITHDGATLPLSSFTVHQFATTPVAAGQYNLCWCPRPAAENVSASNSSQMPCLLEDHSVTAGALTIVGPSPLQAARTCISGQACAIHGLTGAGAYHLTPEDQLLIQDTCGARDGLLPRVARNPIAAQTALVFSSGVIFSWSTAPSTAGGSYRMCWCAAGFACSSADHFRVDAGELFILGPAPLAQDRTCVSGRSCSVEGLQVFPPGSHSSRSLQLNMSLSVMALDTCGTFSLPPRLAPASEASDRHGLLLSDQVSSAGGVYRLCWCGLPPCEKATDFRVDVGQLTLLGPSPLQQQMTCVSGQSCSLHVSSSTIPEVEMLAHASMYLFDSCPPTSSPSPVAGAQAPLRQSSPVVLTAAGGVYRICWCSAVDQRLCAPTDYTVDAGELTLIGPSPLSQARTCVAGLACRFHDLDGLYLQAGDQLLLLNTCGQTSYLDEAAFLQPPGTRSNDTNTSMPATVSALSSILHITGVGGQYRLCWCSSTFECSLPENFKVDIGQLHFLAPSTLGKTCSSGEACQLDEVYQGNSGSASGFILILETCGLASTVVGIGDAVWSSTNSHMMISSAGGLYRLCWCAGTDENLTSPASCHLPGSYDTDLGSLMVIGPAPLEQHRTCIAGQYCKLSPPEGHFPADLSSSGTVAILDTCAVAMSSGLFALTWSPNESRSLSLFASLQNETRSRWLDEGGLFRLCWCMDPEHCSSFEDFKTDFGGLLVVGPSPLLQLRTCVSGHSCSFEGVTGVGLSSAYHVTKIRIYQDGATSHDVRIWELYHSESSSGPWTKAFNGAAAPGVGQQEFGGWAPSASPYWRLVVLQTYSGQEPRLREVQFVAQGDEPVRFRSDLGVVWASGLVYSSGGISYSASKLIDGKLGDASRTWALIGAQC